MNNNFNNCKVGVALSGGGAKGIAHLGVLKALEDRGVQIGRLSGVSAGAIMGAMYADGNRPEDLCEYFKQCDLFSMLSPVNMMKTGGFSKMDKFRRFISKKITSKNFEDLKIPLTINATELNAGCNVYFSSGPLLDCIIASASVPICFNPVEINGKQFVDGGFFCNMPASILRKQGCDLVIGIHVNPITYVEKSKSLIDVSERVFHLAVNGNTIEQKKSCDIVIETTKAKDYGMFDASRADEIYNIGYEAAEEALNNFDWDQYMTRKSISRPYTTDERVIP